jgi:hypothetical protein
LLGKYLALFIGHAAINVLTMEDEMFDCFGGKKLVVNKAFFLVMDSLDSCAGVWNFVSGLHCSYSLITYATFLKNVKFLFF